MNKRRYDDVVRFVASVLFGTSFRQFVDLTRTFHNLGCSEILADVTTVVFFAVFFRNVHGLIAYDTWVEKVQYEPSFEQRSLNVFANFLFGLAVSMLAPYVFIYLLTNNIIQHPCSVALWI